MPCSSRPVGRPRARSSRSNYPPTRVTPSPPPPTACSTSRSACLQLTLHRPRLRVRRVEDVPDPGKVAGRHHAEALVLHLADDGLKRAGELRDVDGVKPPPGLKLVQHAP